MEILNEFQKKKYQKHKQKKEGKAKIYMERRHKGVHATKKLKRRKFQ